MEKRWVKKMNKLILFIALFFFSNGFSALPPQYQNERDLNSMVEFARGNMEVLKGLKSISLDPAEIIYLRGWPYPETCKIPFIRKASNRGRGWAGPAEPLVPGVHSCKK